MEKDLTPFYLHQVLCNLLSYKGSSTGGGVRNKKGLVGTHSIHTNLAKCSCVCKRSSVHMLQSMTNSPSAVKYR